MHNALEKWNVVKADLWDLFFRITDEAVLEDIFYSIVEGNTFVKKQNEFLLLFHIEQCQKLAKELHEDMKDWKTMD